MEKMDENQPELPLSTFWYFVVFIAGLYYGVTFVSGGMSALFLILVPPLLCLFMAIVASGGIGRRALLGTITLYVNFAFSFSIGYAIASAGIIRFVYR